MSRFLHFLCVSAQEEAETTRPHRHAGTGWVICKPRIWGGPRLEYESIAVCAVFEDSTMTNGIRWAQTSMPPLDRETARALRSICGKRCSLHGTRGAGPCRGLVQLLAKRRPGGEPSLNHHLAHRLLCLQLDGGALERITRGLQSAPDASPRDKSLRCGHRSLSLTEPFCRS